MRAMPSPTSSTWPTSVASLVLRYSVISFVSTEAISSALNPMPTALDDLIPNIQQPGPHRAVELPVEDAHHQAAQQFRIDLHVQHRLQVQGVVDILRQPLPLLVRQGHCGAHQDADAPGPL